MSGGELRGRSGRRPLGVPPRSSTGAGLRGPRSDPDDRSRPEPSGLRVSPEGVLRPGLSRLDRSLRAVSPDGAPRGGPSRRGRSARPPSGRGPADCLSRGPSPSRRRSLERRSPLPKSWVVTPGASAREGPRTSIRCGSDRFLTSGGYTETMVMPSISKSASALTTSPALAWSYNRPPARTPRGLSAPAARQVHVPSACALVNSISIRRGTVHQPTGWPEPVSAVPRPLHAGRRSRAVANVRAWLDYRCYSSTGSRLRSIRTGANRGGWTSWRKPAAG